MPGWAALVIFIIILFWLGLMEGLQVALVELKRVDIEQFRWVQCRMDRSKPMEPYYYKTIRFTNVENAGETLSMFWCQFRRALFRCVRQGCPQQ